MNDKELLELAAKACGFLGTVTEYPSGYVEMGLSNHFKSNGSNVWMPLLDEGDRYRLAKQLKFVVDFEFNTVSVDILGEAHIFQWGGNIDEAHAFVIAAAEIGKTNEI